MRVRDWHVAVWAAMIAGGLGVAPAVAQSAGGPKVDVLSSQTSMVTGGDALIKVSGATRPVVAVDGTDVSAVFKSDRRDSWIGLVSGLKDGDNALTVKTGVNGATTTLTLTNHPLNGTLFAGQQQAPYLCEDQGFGLGPAKDASCTTDPV